MGRRVKYPRVGYSRRQGKEHSCKSCGELTNQVVEIQTSYFRGEDDVYWWCNDCRQMVKDQKGNDFYEAQRIYNIVQSQEHATS